MTGTTRPSRYGEISAWDARRRRVEGKRASSPGTRKRTDPPYAHDPGWMPSEAEIAAECRAIRRELGFPETIDLS